MKKTLIIIATSLPLLCLSPAIAQPEMPGKSRSSSSLSTNYRISLTVNEENSPTQELSFVVASNAFKVSSPDTTLRFSGNIEETEGETLKIIYDLSLQKEIETSTTTTGISGGAENITRNIAFRDAIYSASAIMSLDSPLTILTTGEQEFKLKIAKAGNE